MTIQSHDEFVYRGRRVFISAFTGRGIFWPPDFGLEPKMISTACYRGYRCRYSVEGGSLNLRELRVLAHQPGPLLGGKPRFDQDRHLYVYEDLPEPVPFTGGILVGEGQAVSAIWHLLVQRDSESYRLFRLFDVFHELVFESGRLADATDRSATVRRLSEKIGGGRSSFTEEDQERWLMDEFSQRGYVDYDQSLYGVW